MHCKIDFVTVNQNSLSLIDPGVFANYQKLIEMFKSSLSLQLRVAEKRTMARLNGLVLGFHFGQVSPCRRAPTQCFDSGAGSSNKGIV